MIKLIHGNLRIEVLEDKAIRVRVPKTLTVQQLTLLQLYWPCPIKQTEHGIRLAVRFWPDDALPSSWFGAFDDIPTSWHHATLRGGRMLSEYDWNWLEGKLTEEQVLIKLYGNGAQDERTEQYDLFKVGSDWREIGFVTDPTIEWLALDTNDWSVEHWTQEEYEQHLEEELENDYEEI